VCAALAVLLCPTPRLIVTSAQRAANFKQAAKLFVRNLLCWWSWLFSQFHFNCNEDFDENTTLPSNVPKKIVRKWQTYICLKVIIRGDSLFFLMFEILDR
jgi:hypothetical protein